MSSWEAPSPELGTASSRTWGVGVEPGVHFYFAGRAPEGFWVGPHVELSTNHQTLKSHYLMSRLTPSGEVAEVVESDSSSRTVQYGGSLRLGYTAIVSPGLTIQVGAGLSVFSSRFTSFGPSSQGSVFGGAGGLLSPSPGRNWSVAPRMTVGLGWAF